VNYKKIFSIDFSKLALLLTPIFWRSNIMIDWINSFIEPIAIIHKEFIKYREKQIYKVVHNGQVILLEKVLNDAFDSSERRVFISELPVFDPLYIYTTAENKPVFIGSQYLYPIQPPEIIDVDFILNFPVLIKPNNPIALINFENKIKALTNYYKIASKRFKILWI
jgi:hypothetical protein